MEDLDGLAFHITASEAFPAMERLVLGAQDSLDISLHIFSPRTKTRDKHAHENRLIDWADLLIDASHRGVSIRLLLNDFDPIGGPELHASVWERVAMLMEKIERKKDDLRGPFSILVSGPGGQSGRLIRTAIWPFARSLAQKYLVEFRQKGRTVPPRLAALCNAKDEIRWWPPAPNFTQTFHQKFLIADNKHLIVGGLDIDERRFDDMDHDVPAPETWHDLSAEVHGSIANDLTRHFEKSWETAQSNGRYIFDLGVTARKLVDEDLIVDNEKPAIVVTTARPSSNLLSFGPRPDLNSLEVAHLDLIRRAESFIYIETQYLRSSKIRDGLIEAARRNPHLFLFILLPAAPDVVAFQGKQSPVHRYGEWLQMRALNMIRKAFDERMGAFCLTNDRDRNEQNERDALRGKSIVYVHSKLILRDDQELIVSSANLNGRSMQWDFEAGVVVKLPESIAELREQLWSSHLGHRALGLDPNRDGRGTMVEWEKCAHDWPATTSSNQRCGVVPFPMKKTQRFAKRHFFIPENMV